MAVHAPITGAPTRASEINRRGLLAGLALTPALAAIPAAAIAADRWNMLRARYEQAAADVRAFDETIHQPARDRVDAIVGPRPPLWFEHTARSGQTARFAVIANGCSPYVGPPYQQLHDAALARWQAWNARDEAASSDPHWRAIDAKMARLWDVEGAARIALMAEPAPDGTALAFKVHVALTNDELWDEDRSVLVDDARRLGKIV